MKVDLYEKPDGEWQADVVLPDGADCHAVGRTPGYALMELGQFIETRKRASDLSTLLNVVVAARQEPPHDR